MYLITLFWAWNAFEKAFRTVPEDYLVCIALITMIIIIAVMIFK